MKEHPQYFELDTESQISAKVAEMLNDDDFITDGSFSDAWNRDVDTIKASETLLAKLMQVDIEQIPLEIRPALEAFRVPVMKALEETAREILEKGDV